MFTKAQRSTMAADIISAMQAKYEEEGEEGDFDDGYRYLAEDASNEELQYEFDKWCK
jgi:hypothetical protein